MRKGTSICLSLFCFTILNLVDAVCFAFPDDDDRAVKLVGDALQSAVEFLEPVRAAADHCRRLSAVGGVIPGTIPVGECLAADAASYRHVECRIVHLLLGIIERAGT